LVLQCDGEADAHVPRRPTAPPGRGGARRIPDHAWGDPHAIEICERFRGSFRSPRHRRCRLVAAFPVFSAAIVPLRHCCRRWRVARENAASKVDTRHPSSSLERPGARGDAFRTKHPCFSRDRGPLFTRFSAKSCVRPPARGAFRRVSSRVAARLASSGVSSERDHPAMQECLFNLRVCPPDAVDAPSAREARTSALSSRSTPSEGAMTRSLVNFAWCGQPPFGDYSCRAPFRKRG